MTKNTKKGTMLFRPKYICSHIYIYIYITVVMLRLYRYSFVVFHLLTVSVHIGTTTREEYWIKWRVSVWFTSSPLCQKTWFISPTVEAPKKKMKKKKLITKRIAAVMKARATIPTRERYPPSTSPWRTRTHLLRGRRRRLWTPSKSTSTSGSGRPPGLLVSATPSCARPPPAWSRSSTCPSSLPRCCGLSRTWRRSSRCSPRVTLPSLKLLSCWGVYVSNKLQKVAMLTLNKSQQGGLRRPPPTPSASAFQWIWPVGPPIIKTQYTPLTQNQL